jgi:hypothetical protein
VGNTNTLTKRTSKTETRSAKCTLETLTHACQTRTWNHTEMQRERPVGKALLVTIVRLLLVNDYIHTHTNTRFCLIATLLQYHSMYYLSWLLRWRMMQHSIPGWHRCRRIAQTGLIIDGLDIVKISQIIYLIEFSQKELWILAPLRCCC